MCQAEGSLLNAESIAQGRAEVFPGRGCSVLRILTRNSADKTIILNCKLCHFIAHNISYLKFLKDLPQVAFSTLQFYV